MWIVDEAYADFSEASFTFGDFNRNTLIRYFPGFSKAWGCAAIRLGMAFASEVIIEIFNKIKYPYNINLLLLQEAIRIMGIAPSGQHWNNNLVLKSALEEFKTKVLKYNYLTDATSSLLV